MAQAHALAETPVIPAGGDYHEYTIGSRLEICQFLQLILKQGELISASVGSDDFFLTAILALDEKAGWVLLECGRQHDQAQRVIKRGRLLCTTTLDKIKIQFTCTQITAVVHEGHPAFRAPVPDALIRLQRRNYFRVATPMTAPVKCSISAVDADPAAAVQLNLLDISCGGIAVLTPPTLFAPEIGMEYACALHLPGTPALRARVEARNAYAIKLANGKTTQRSGFAFVGLSESRLSVIQRYIMAIERQRRARGA